MNPTLSIPSVDGIDTDDTVIHIRIPGLMMSYCGQRLETSVHIPEPEVTDSAWCADCEAIWR